MAPKTTNSGQIVRDNGNGTSVPRRSDHPLADLINGLKNELARALPKHLTSDRLARLALTALRTTKDLDKCSKPSFAASIMACAALGLEPNTPLGQAYLIPRRIKGSHECTVIVGYQGMLDLARRSGVVAGIQAVPVFQGDQFDYRLGLYPDITHVPDLDNPDREDPRALTHVYAVCHLKDKDARPIFVVLSRAQVEQRRKRGGSGSGSFSPWSSDYIPMACKSAIRELFKWMPRSAELARVEVLESGQERGGSAFESLPEESAQALLGAGYAPEDDASDGAIETGGEVVDEEPDREPGID